MWLCVRHVFCSVSRLSRRADYVFWCFQNVLVCPPCFLVCQECWSVFTLLSDVSRLSQFLCLVFGESRLSRCVRLVFWCVQNIPVCPPCFLVLPGCGGMSSFFAGMTRLSRFSCLVFSCIQNFAACPPCFLVFVECRSVSTLLSVVSRISWCVQNMAVGVSPLPSGVSRMW